MSEQEIRNVADEADIIIDGYTYTKQEDGTIRVLNLNNTDEACVLDKSGEMIETSMSDEVLFRVKAYYFKNRELMEV